MSDTIYEKLSYFRSLPNTQNSRHLIIDYISKHKLRIEINQQDNFKMILTKLTKYYISKINLIIAVIKSYKIRKRYTEITSKCFEFNFRLSVNEKLNDLTIITGSFPVIKRRLVNTTSLIDYSDLRSLDPELILIVREKGLLYSFDLREIKKIPQLINPYTNEKFSQPNILLIKDRLSHCNSQLLNVEEPDIIDINLKITEFVTNIELHGGLYLDINYFKKLTNQALHVLIHRVIEIPLVSMILSQEQMKLPTIPINQEGYRELCIDLLLFVSQYNDEFLTNRCIQISHIIHGLQGPSLIFIPGNLFLSMLGALDQMESSSENNHRRSHPPAQLRPFAPLPSLTSMGPRDPHLPLVNYSESDDDSDLIRASDSSDEMEIDLDDIWNDLNPITHISQQDDVEEKEVENDDNIEEIKSQNDDNNKQPTHHYNLRSKKRKLDDGSNSSDHSQHSKKKKKK